MCPDRGLVHSYALACAVDKAELLWRLLHPQSYGCSLPARPDEPLPRASQELASLAGVSGGPRLARAGSLSHDPSACPSSLSVGLVLVARELALAAS